MLRASLYAIIALSSSLSTPLLALDVSKGPTGANHLRAHAYATGAGVEVGILDTVFFGINTPNYLEGRLIAQYDFYNNTPSQAPIPLADPQDAHETIAAHVIASDHPMFTGVAPNATIVDAAINDLNLDSRRAASSWLVVNRGTSIFNLSAGFGPNTNGAGAEAFYWDWLMREKDVLLVAAAGNTGGLVTIPADSFNGIAVGAQNQSTQARWTSSAYTLAGGLDGPEVRGKPDILAPGANITDGISVSGVRFSGTSFAAPHVVGAAALLKDFANRHATADALDHRGLKALLLNSARKRHISGPELLSPVSSDSAAASAVFDKDHVNCGAAPCSFNNPAAAGLTPAWTPAAWNYDGTTFTATRPLDDEQGTGFLDAARAIVNLAGGNFGPGQAGGIGWDQSAIAPTDAPAAHTYSLNQALAAGSFLTATLVWDRVTLESDGDGIVDDDDSYAFGELANLDLRLVGATDELIAASVSTTDNVEHLHIPLPADAGPGDYKLQVAYSGGALATDFALAWWTSPLALVPGDYNLDGVVGALDYTVWRANFGTTTATSPLIYGDGNGDGAVDAADYTLWRAHMGESWANLPGQLSAAVGAVPEPASLAIAAAALLGFATIGRRRAA